MIRYRNGLGEAGNLLSHAENAIIANDNHIGQFVNLRTADQFGNDFRADTGRISQQYAQRRFFMLHRLFTFS